MMPKDKHEGFNRATFIPWKVAIMRPGLIRLFLIRQDDTEGFDLTEKGAFMNTQFPGGPDAIPVIPAKRIGEEYGFHILKGHQFRIFR